MHAEHLNNVGESRQTGNPEASRRTHGMLGRQLLTNRTGQIENRHMHTNAAIKPKPRSQGNRQTHFSPHATPDQHEVQELDPREIARLPSEDQRRAGRTPRAGKA
jgi:hypothetical protein